MDKINCFMDDMRTPKTDDDKPDIYWVVVRTIKDTKTILSSGIVNNLSLDHDMGPGDTGYDLVKWMEETNTWPQGVITLHTANIVGRDNMKTVLARRNK